MADENTTPQLTKAQIRQTLIGLYLLIAIGFIVYGTFLGDLANRGFFFNFGRGLVWPFLLFPILGKIFGSILIVVLVIAVLAAG